MPKILSVDDSRIMRSIMRGAVEALGYDFLEAADGVEGLAVLEGESAEVDLILLDVNMPNMDGFTMLEKLKQDDRFGHIPVMMVTTESERVQVIRGIKAGAANYLCKPFTQEDLSTKIVETLSEGM